MRQSNYILKDPHEKMFEFCLTNKMFKTKDTERYAVHGVAVRHDWATEQYGIFRRKHRRFWFCQGGIRACVCVCVCVCV